ncbi:zf-HC2 domain-containing protein [Massilia sp. TS11]|uniref:zf-HC2 domain-containing protein n=1 Tax=Massilia sp. TS11 TaxID=2908003 RepID=UPI001EDA28EB|nr:zf-HC2 domain-containing protein [Massilia sp. TS11]MCG2585257.1 zf-HC2 domain-containing protein [Massilia sp. TS11]
MEGVKITCKDAHRLVSEGLDRELSLLERTRLRLHLLACGACSRFNGQMDLLRQAMRRLPPE